MPAPRQSNDTQNPRGVSRLHSVGVRITRLMSQDCLSRWLPPHVANISLVVTLINTHIMMYAYNVVRNCPSDMRAMQRKGHSDAARTKCTMHDDYKKVQKGNPLGPLHPSNDDIHFRSSLKYNHHEQKSAPNFPRVSIDTGLSRYEG